MASILAVDDSPSMRQLVSMTLKQGGHQVHMANDGVDALALMREIDVDVVLTDVHMPNMDGITLTRELRQLGNCRSKPILVLTTESAGDVKQRAREAGATGWVLKPFDPDSLLRVIERVLSPGKQQAAQ